MIGRFHVWPLVLLNRTEKIKAREEEAFAVCLRSSSTSREMKISRTWFTSRVTWQMTIDEELTPPTIFNSGEKRKQYEDMELGSISLFKAHGIIYNFNKIIVNKSWIQKSLFLSWKIGFCGREEDAFWSVHKSLRQIFKYRMSKTFSPGLPEN